MARSGRETPETSTGARKTRIIQTNSAGDFVDVIDPATNKVVGVINDIDIAHGVVGAPDGTRLYVTNESMSTVDVIDGKTLTIIRRIPSVGPPEQSVGDATTGRRCTPASRRRPAPST